MYVMPSVTMSNGADDGLTCLMCDALGWRSVVGLLMDYDVFMCDDE